MNRKMALFHNHSYLLYEIIQKNDRISIESSIENLISNFRTMFGKSVYKYPFSFKDVKEWLPITRWSNSSIPIIFPASTRRLVT